MMPLQLFTYVSVVIFGFGMVRTVLKYARMPIHLRWELYPVAHEKDKDYGGSYFEDMEWWNKSREKSLINVLKYMIPEILFIRALYHHNRRLWAGSFPFHGGLFTLIGLLSLLLIGAVLQVLGVAIIPSATSWFARSLYYVTILIACVGLSSTLWGCARLLFMRLNDDDLKLSSTPLDYLNLVFIMAVVLCTLTAWLSADSGFIMTRKYIQSLIMLEPLSLNSMALKVDIVLFALFMIYFPFTHMTHMFTKFFTYHRVRWEDEPNRKGGRIEAHVKSVLQHNVRWAAPHIPAGKKWSEIAKGDNR